jgi:hypothetical protein
MLRVRPECHQDLSVSEPRLIQPRFSGLSCGRALATDSRNESPQAQGINRATEINKKGSSTMRQPTITPTLLAIESQSNHLPADPGSGYHGIRALENESLGYRRRTP